MVRRQLQGAPLRQYCDSSLGKMMPTCQQIVAEVLDRLELEKVGLLQRHGRNAFVGAEIASSCWRSGESREAVYEI